MCSKTTMRCARRQPTVAKREITLQCAEAVVPVLAKQSAGPMSMFVNDDMIRQQVRDWYSKGVSLQVETTTPFGQQLIKAGWIQP